MAEPKAIIPWIRHHSHCDIPQCNSSRCSCGLAEALERAFPGEMAAIREHSDRVKAGYRKIPPLPHMSNQCGGRCEVHRDA
jgi:hypothetical protein